MLGIRISEETTTICLNPKFVMNGSREGFTVPMGHGYKRKWRWLAGSFGVAYSNAGGHTLWLHWKNRCMPRDWRYLTQCFARKKAYGRMF